MFFCVGEVSPYAAIFLFWGRSIERPHRKIRRYPLVLCWDFAFIISIILTNDGATCSVGMFNSFMKGEQDNLPIDNNKTSCKESASNNIHFFFSMHNNSNTYNPYSFSSQNCRAYQHNNTCYPNLFCKVQYRYHILNYYLWKYRIYYNDHHI